MLRTLYIVRQIGLGIGVIACALIIGCSNTTPDTASSFGPPPGGQAQQKAILNKAAQNIPFNQVTLESPVTPFTNNKLVFLRFSFADLDGKIYKCELPKEMSKGSFTQAEWIRTFRLYKLPQVIGKKVIVKKTRTDINDFPFISPKAQAGGAAATPQTPQAPQNLPPLAGRRFRSPGN